MRIQHAIFRTPHLVEPTIVERPTPKVYRLNRAGESLGATMPMWQVQTVGYTSGADVMIGLVSRNRGFLDSPDAEVISAGVNSKSAGGVAIGRHGNFMLWGFAASPTQLTDEAKLVFVNSVHYISRFDGKGVVARKKAGTIMRTDLNWELQRMLKRASAKQLGPKETLWAKYFLPKAQWPLWKDKPQLIAAYLQQNADYFRPTGWYEIEVDQDLKNLGIPNHAKDFLTRVVSLLDVSEQAPLAMKVLTRYTAQSFEKPEDWKLWASKNRERIFFSESAGYLWLSNDQVAAKEG